MQGNGLPSCGVADFGLFPPLHREHRVVLQGFAYAAYDVAIGEDGTAGWWLCIDARCDKADSSLLAVDSSFGESSMSDRTPPNGF